jgi:hypothetical protein
LFVVCAGGGGVDILYCGKQRVLEMRKREGACKNLGRCNVILGTPCAVSEWCTPRRGRLIRL